MELREIRGVVLKCYSDELFKFTYIKFLTENTLESIKIPTQIENFKLNHVLNPNFLLQIEVIKTRKNWILKNVLEYQRISEPKKYVEFIKQSEISKITLNHTHEDQEIDILSYFIQTVQKIDTVDLKIYETELLSKLGF